MNRPPEPMDVLKDLVKKSNEINKIRKACGALRNAMTYEQLTPAYDHISKLNAEIKSHPVFEMAVQCIKHHYDGDKNGEKIIVENGETFTV